MVAYSGAVCTGYGKPLTLLQVAFSGAAEPVEPSFERLVESVNIAQEIGLLLAQLSALARFPGFTLFFAGFRLLALFSAFIRGTDGFFRSKKELAGH